MQIKDCEGTGQAGRPRESRDPPIFIYLRYLVGILTRPLCDCGFTWITSLRI